MLTDNRIKLLDFHLVRHVFLILRGRIVVTVPAEDTSLILSLIV